MEEWLVNVSHPEALHAFAWETFKKSMWWNPLQIVLFNQKLIDANHGHVYFLRSAETEPMGSHVGNSMSGPPYMTASKLKT